MLVPAITVPKRDWDATVDGPPPESSSLLSSSSSSQTSKSPPPQPVIISLPCFSSPVQALLPLYGAHQLDNLGTALTVINALPTDPLPGEILLIPHPLPPLKDMITPEPVARGIKETKWPGRLSFHTVHLPPSTIASNEAPPPPFLVLADAAHNPTSAKALGYYITHLLNQTIVSFKEGPESSSTTNKSHLHKS